MTITTTRLRELAQAATPGPWEHVPGEPWPVSQVPYVAGPNRFGCVCQRVSLDDDAALIVALRNALPELLEALELREACERLDAASGDDRPLITWPVTWPSGDREYAALHRLGGPTRAPTLAALIVALGRL